LGQADDQLDEILGDRRTARCFRLSPSAGDQTLVPAQHCAWSDEPVRTDQSGQQSDQRREYRPIGTLQSRFRIPSAWDRDLVAQHQQFDVLGCTAAGKQHQPGGDPAKREIDQANRHDRRSSASATNN
jgi:hypothetical protein